MIQFGPWEIPDGEFLSEVSSYEKAKAISPSCILAFDPDGKKAEITGRTGGSYYVTMDNCTCYDFEQRELPCKHMIRLALELGESFDVVPKFDPAAAVKFKVDDVISLLEKHWRNGELSYDAFTKCCSSLRSSVSLARRMRRKPKKSRAAEEGQLSMDELVPPPPVKPAEDSSSVVMGNAISCCSHYRECSDAGECVVPDRDYASDCVYRKNLKVGRIFYGQHANGFSPDEYISYQDHVHSLSAEARAIFDRLLISILEYQRGARSVIVRNSPYLDEIASYGLFSFSRLESNFPPIKPDQWDYQRLLSPVLNNSQYCSLFQEAQAVRAAELQPLRTALKEAKDRGDKVEVKRLTSELNNLYKTKPSERTKEFLRQWLNTEEGHPMRDALSEPYRLASIPPDCALYAEEFWHINFIKAESYDRRIYWNTPYYDDGILSVNAKRAEEERRIRLSPGYTPEEKQELLSALSKTVSHDEKDE